MTVNHTVPTPEPEREPLDVHLDRGGSTTACGLNFAALGHLQFDHLAEAVTCAACLDVVDRAASPLAPATLVDGQLSEPAAVPPAAPENASPCWACNGTGTVGDLDTEIFECTACEGSGLSASRRALLAPALNVEAHEQRAPERRTVGLEVLTPELREAENARRRVGVEMTPFKVTPILLDDNARVGVVVREGDRVYIPDVDTDWAGRVPYPASLLARLLEQAQYEVDALMGDELLMPGLDVLAVLAGRPVGGYTAKVDVTYQAVQPGWWLLTDTVVDGAQTSVWQLVVDVSPECVDETCTNARRDCRVLTVLGRGPQHVVCWYPAAVRIPADQAVTA